MAPPDYSQVGHVHTVELNLAPLSTDYHTTDC